MTPQEFADPHTPLESQKETEEILERAVLLLNGNILGLVLGILTGLGIFIGTNFLVLKGGPSVGQHLGLLRVFFRGYSVTFIGSFIGLIYGLITGYIAGFVIAWLYNFIVRLKRR